MKNSSYMFCGMPASPYKEYFVDFGETDGRGNMIVYNELDALIPYVEHNELFGPNARIFVNSCGCRNSGVCVAEVRDEKLVRIDSMFEHKEAV